MPPKDSVIAIENKLAHTMLEEAVANNAIKQVLHEIALVLIANTLKPIQQKLSAMSQFSDLSQDYQEMLVNLAAEHSAERRQYGAQMPEVENS